MEEKNKKELIDVLKQGLKSMENVPYREGAWEDFRSKYVLKPTPKKLHPMYWGAAAAVALLATFGVLYWDTIPAENELGKSPHKITMESQATHSSGLSSTPKTEEQNVSENPSLPSPTLADEQPHSGLPFASNISKPSIFEQEDVSIVALSSLPATHNVAKIDLVPMAFQKVHSTSIGAVLDRPLHSPVDLGDHMVMAQAMQTNNMRLSTSQQVLLPRKAKITDRFEIGAFLSPGVTGEKFDMGGGLVLGYQLNNKLTLRTGASFNQYEVGILAANLPDERKEDYFDAPVERGDVSMISKNIPYQTNKVLLPNLNAVSGKVQTLDIPIELKYNINTQFYTTAGVSYAAVLSQERYNHYKEYTDPLTYSSDSDSDKPTNQSQTVVEKTAKSAQENVSSNGFGGFVNLSLGRKTSLSKNLNLSIEPYVKFPIGQFKRADMNYTNGGIKIITSF